jgi:DNA-binding NtrC family response regulator
MNMDKNITKTNQPVRVLHIEDSRTETMIIKKFLTGIGPGQYEVSHSETFEQAKQTLQKQRGFDIVLLDLSLPDAQGIDLLRAIEDIVPTLPVIVVTGGDEQELGLQVMRAGAQSLLLKGKFNPQALHDAIQHAIEQKAAEIAHREATGTFRRV